MVMAQSLFKLLKAQHPQAEIDVLAPPWSKPLLSRMPEVDEIVLLPVGHGQLKLRTRWRLGRRLAVRHYDQAIILPRALKAALVPFAARARRRTGFLGEWRFGLLNDIRPLDRRALPRTVDRFITLGLPPGAPMPSTVPTPRLQAHSDGAEAVLTRLKVKPPRGPVLGMCPGAEYGPAKRWPAAYFAAVAREKLNAGWSVWLFGSKREAAITGEIQRLTGNRCLDLGGATSLAEAIDLMALTAAVVSNDSGLMHVAAALDRRLVAVYGSSDPRHTPPLGTKAEILYLGLACSPCFKRECPLVHLHCLKELPPERVLDALPRGNEEQ